LALYRYLADTWYPAQGAALDDKLFSPADGQRFALGARAALVVYRDEVAGSVVALNGTLERVLTATPWSEFDSAYAFRGGPAGTYLRDRFYAGSDDRLNANLCKATVLDLAATNIDDSEQSLPFIGGWKFLAGTSGALGWIECTMRAPADPELSTALRAMKRNMPTIKIVLMTHTAQLATLPGGKTYSEWSKSGACAAVQLPQGLVTTPRMVYEGLMGWNGGKPVVSAAEARSYFNDVVGIDTAAPETTCFSLDGMAYYRQLIAAVYDASKSRRLAGWHGKLLVHTHVGANFQLDDLLGTLVSDPHDVSQVSGVLGNAALKYLLEARVRCLLGTDAGGVEHSDIVKEYEYASSLIAYWNQTDPVFRARSGDAGRETLFANVRWHLANMASDAARPY
jgi:hypothetical protein